MYQGILAAGVFIACIGSKFWESKNCMAELAFARNEDKKLVFVILPNHPAGDIHPSIRIMIGNSIFHDLRDPNKRSTEQQDDFARRVSDYAAEARQH